MTLFDKRVLVLASSLGFSATAAHAFFLDGNGYFGLRGATIVNPDFQKDHGTYQATEVAFDLNGEIRANDRASVNLRLGLSDSRDSMYLGDKAKPGQCEPRRNSSGQTDSSCDGRYQGAVSPGYSEYKPVIREAYAKYAFNYCLLTAGRRSRELGMGILYSAGKNPFDTEASVFDGVTCDVNIQKQQDLGFSFGFDKLQETGTFTNNPYDYPVQDANKESYYNKDNHFTDANHYGANSPTDDLDQYFFGINYDDRKTKVAGSFAKQVSIYFSNILGSETKTDVKYLDLYTGFFWGNLAFRNEFVFRMGRSAAPDTVAIGGKRRDDDGNPSTNNVSSTGFAGLFDFTLAKSGASIGPAEFNEGNATRHALILNYAYAPGDANGYYQDRSSAPAATNAAIGETKRDPHATAMLFNKNYKPAMLMFNGKYTSKYLNTGGVFNSQQVTNVALYSLGYRYENQESGNFEMKIITGRLLQSMPSDVKAWYDTIPTYVDSYITIDGKPHTENRPYARPLGYKGNDLGYELDLMYTWQYRREVELGAGVAGALPGKAWEVSSDNKPAAQIGLQGTFGLRF